MEIIKTKLKRYRWLVLTKHLVWEMFSCLCDAKFFYRQRFRKFSISTYPTFESDIATDWFVERLRNAGMYLEFGSGGSTYLAAKLKIPLITVDSDRYFLESVRQKIILDGFFDARTQQFTYADIGLTKSWGRPVKFLSFTQRRKELFSKYSNFPISNHIDVDQTILILVDGRFRVACALKTILALRDRSDWVMVVDDYADRSNYSVIEQFAKLDRMIGRMAVFISLTLVDKDKLIKMIQEYEDDYR